VQEFVQEIRRNDMKLVQFTDVHGKEVWINADLVCAIKEYRASTTVISFGTDVGNVSVKLSPLAVAQALGKAE
jgi:hypothetical protein